MVPRIDLGRAAAALLLVILPLACQRDASPSVSPSTPESEAPTTTEPSPAEPDALPSAPPANAETTASGVAILIVSRGDPEGPQPRAGDKLELRYNVWDEEGRSVGASRPKRSETLSTHWLPRGWAEAMYTLHEGDHAQIWIPAALAYPNDPDAPQGPLVIDVELLAVHSLVTADATDVPLAHAPPNALRTASGLAYLVLRAGTGARHPSPEARVTVHYAGWTADGERFDSSYERDRPTTFPLTAVISGWQEAVPLMVEGEKTRFWIPAEAAYGHSPGKPQGLLIFDIELISIDD